MYAFTVLTGVLGLSLSLGTGAFAEMKGGEPGASNNPQDNVPSKIQRSTPAGGFGEDFPKGSGPGERGDALTSAEKGDEAGTSINAKKNVPEEIQRSTPAGGFGEDFPKGSGPGERIDASTGSKH